MYGTDVQISPTGAKNNPSQLQERSVFNNFRGDYLYSGTKKYMFNQSITIFIIIMTLFQIFHV